MLNAKEANKIANSELLQVMNLIRASAYRGRLSLTLDYIIKYAVTKVLKDYGYEVDIRKVPVYYETPYGVTGDEPSGYKEQTTISWK